MPEKYTKKEFASILRQAMNRQKFADFYNGKHADYLSDGPHLGITDEAIEKDLLDLFGNIKPETK